MTDKRPAGRPKAKHPRDVRVTVRLTEQEVDLLYRISRGGETLSACVRKAITCYVHTLGGNLRYSAPDNEVAHLKRNLRQARRAERVAQPELEAIVGEAIGKNEEELQHTTRREAARGRTHEELRGFHLRQ